MNTQNPRTFPWWVGATLISLSLALVYFPLLSAPFVWTDHAEVEQGALVPTTAGEFFDALTQAKGKAKSTARQRFISTQSKSSHAYHRPIKAFSYGLDHWLGKGQAWSFHLSNLMFHLATCLLLLTLFRRLWGQVLPGLAELLALWHALNPLHTECAAWISARSDSLMTLFVLMALGLQLAARRAKKGAWLLRAAGAFCLLLAIGAKESGLVGLGLVGLLAFGLPEGRARTKRLLEELSLPVLACGLALIWRFAVVGDLAVGRMAAAKGLNFWTLLDLLGRNLQQSFLPFGHGVSDTLAVVHGPSLFGAGALLGLGLWLGLAWRWRRRAPGLMLAALAWLGCILPVSQALPLLHPRGDRYLYLPAIFAEACLVAGLLWAFGRLRSHGLARWGLAAGLFLGLAAAATISHLDAGQWRDEGRLFRRATQEEANCAECWNNLAYYEALAGRYAQAIQASERGLGVDRQRYRTARDGFSLRFILAQASLAIGRPQGATQALQEIHLKVGAQPATLLLLAKAYAQGGRLADARLLERWAEAGQVPDWNPSLHEVFSCAPGKNPVPLIHDAPPEH